MDIRMPGGDGIEATCGILGDPGSAGCRVLVLSMFELDEYVYGALRAGASGFLLKDCEPDRLLEAVRRIHDGESLFAPSVLTRLVAHYVAHPARGPAHPPARLTPREVEVLALVGRGLSNTRSPRTSSSPSRRSRPTSVACWPSCTPATGPSW